MSPLLLRSAARPLTPRLALCCIALAMLSACNRSGEQTAMIPPEPGELTWARNALERNPRYEVLASDTQTRVFTVRDRTTGLVETIGVNDLAAAPIAQLKAAASASSSSTPASAAEQRSTPMPATASTSATPTEQLAQVVDNSPAAAAERARAAEANYTIDRTGGQLRVSGPGVSIVSSGKSPASGSLGAAGVRATDPIICEGKRLLKLDDRSIYVEGNAVIARGGCELYITNSRIVATGTGLIVEDAVVHIANSHIEGLNGSFDASDRAKLYLRTSTFEGVPRRTELASVLDQGGNQWR